MSHNCLSKQGADVFLLTTMKCYDLGIIGHTEWINQLEMLLELADPSSGEAEYARFHLDLNGVDIREVEKNSDIDGEGNVEIWPEEYDELNGVRSGRKSDQVILNLVVCDVKGMSKHWVFHQFDADPRPSVPHGHWKGANHPKLNPYSGIAYDARGREDQEKSLDRKTKIRLWDSRDFRKFALKAIDWYVREHPHYGFPLPHHYRRLPRRRLP